MIIELALFLTITVLALIFSFMIFVVKDILHAALMLAALFFANSLYFLMLDQPLLAVVQLFIMIGGITTFLFVGVASFPYSRFKHTKAVGFSVLWAIVFLIMVIPMNYLQVYPYQSNTFGPDAIASSLGSSSPLFYLMLLTMFGVSLGAILLLRKVGANK